MKQDWENKTTTTTKHSSMENLYGELKRSKGSDAGGGFPPPISCIGKSGKPCFCFKSYREGGRFVLEQVKVPTQEFLHACREDGRLKLRFVQPNDDEVLEDEEFGEEDEEGTAQKQYS
ncbi:Rho GTPase activating protein with PAK-box/P21-Rho-binding domain [Hibiscus syriacus]|uniref:Rho GTPase activating protein with PAK-box/P21-Rho-binding domain n=1 Tax=Hibiscus syriacus TaxID=106335 RepID=A0A6A2ZIT0_HIBSY|nr:Rho GTPase activating protein with PAK-box/P21-Rho-binding domain [Hibiscus syriacus]